MWLIVLGDLLKEWADVIAMFIGLIALIPMIHYENQPRKKKRKKRSKKKKR